MLYEFHRKQNAKKLGTVHATYFITGIRQVEATPQTNGIHGQDGEDTVMQSSPPLPSSSAPKPDETMEEPAAIRSVMLVKEEYLEQAKGQFDSISSIHVYSLEANGLSDVQALTDCNRKISVSYASEDPLQAWKQYGTIQNPNANRRARRTAPPPPAPIEKNAEAKTKPFATAVKAKEAEMKPESKVSSNTSTPEPEKKGIPKPVQSKRQNSDIFKSFAKGKTQAKKESQGSAEASPAPEPEDEPMGGFSDDDLSIDALEEQQPEVDAPSGKSKKEREAELQAMMDQEDEPMKNAPTPTEQGDEPGAEAGKAESPKEEEPKETVTVENGRRRGKRRIMKKKKVKDEEGYLGMSCCTCAFLTTFILLY